MLVLHSLNPCTDFHHIFRLCLPQNLFILFYLGFYVAFNTVQVISQRVVGRAEEISTYIQFVRVLYCKLPTNGKQLPAFPLEAVSRETNPGLRGGRQVAPCLPQKYPELIRFWEVSGKNCCHGNT